MIKDLVKEKRQLYNLLLTPSEYKEIKNRADKYTGGNFSAWLRYTAMKYEPKKSELTTIPDTV